jgi:D-apiose dehydrogenase
MADLRFAVLGAGFWARYQLAAWGELPGARCVAIYNRSRERAQDLADHFGVPAVYDDVETMLREQEPDFVDIITAVETHPRFVALAAEHGVAAICQKPMAPTLAQAEQMVAATRAAGTRLFIHENWRWQPAIRRFGELLHGGAVGRTFRGRITFNFSYPVFANQPFLRDLEQFIISDMGSHLFDVARFLFGEPDRLYCQTHRVHPDIRGEDVATTLLHAGDTSVLVEMSYASRAEHEHYPQTYVYAEGSEGSLELAPVYQLRLTTAAGTTVEHCPPPVYRWTNPAYTVVHASIVACNANLLQALRGQGAAETTGEDNLRTTRLVFGAYDSARSGDCMHVAEEK